MIEAYLDIETTGLSPEYSEITVIGIHLVDGHRERFVQLIGDNITAEKLLETLEGVSIIHTYNGSRFDLPFIHARIGIDLTRNFAHCDLMYDCWKNNLYGGLKRVEQTLGISRKLKGIDGLEAVKLWWRYINDYDENALKTLCEYNREDVVNLKCLKGKLFPEQYTAEKLRLVPEERKQKIESFGAAYARIRKVLRPMSVEALHYKPDSSSWSTHEIIIHLADAEANGYVRFRRFIAEPGSKVMGYDQDYWADRLDYSGQNMDEALILFKTLRSMTYPLLKKISEEQWFATVEHSERGIMTLEDWLEACDNHVKAHLLQIAGNFEMWKKEMSET